MTNILITTLEGKKRRRRREKSCSQSSRDISAAAIVLKACCSVTPDEENHMKVDFFSEVACALTVYRPLINVFHNMSCHLFVVTCFTALPPYDSSQCLKKTPTSSLSPAGVYILIAAGALMMVVGFLGCCGAIKESPCMLGLVSGVCVSPHFRPRILTLRDGALTEKQQFP